MAIKYGSTKETPVKPKATLATLHTSKIAAELLSEYLERAPLPAAPDIRRGRPKTGTAKKPITVRLDQDIVAALHARGEDWRSFVNDELRRALDL